MTVGDNKELKLHPCYCGGEIKIKKVTKNSGMDGSYSDWELTCSKCGLTKAYAADGFYGRKYKTFEEVANDWNVLFIREKNTKESISYLLHKELDIPISECQKAYNLAIEYLRSQGKLKGNKCDNDHDCEHCDWVECPKMKGDTDGQ
jgi:hypothetical protein